MSFEKVETSRPYWPVVVLWNAIILAAFVAAPFGWKMPIVYVLCLPFAAHVYLRWRHRRRDRMRNL